MQLLNRLSLSIILSGLIFFTSSSGLWAADIMPDGAVAEVNGVAISRQDFDIEMKMVRGNIERSGQKIDESMMTHLQGQVLDHMINAELIYQESRKAGIMISEDAVDAAVENFKKNFPSEAAYHQMLKDLGISSETLRMQFQKGLFSEEFIEKRIAAAVVISDEAKRSFFDANPSAFKAPEEVRASHILVAFDQDGGETAESKAKTEIETIQKELQAGKDFSELAAKFSKCPSSAKGGDLGYFRRGQMDKAFEDAAFGLKPGEISSIVKTRFGFHLIRLEGRNPERNIPFEEAGEKIASYLKKREVNQKIEEQLTQLKGTASIKKML